MLTKLPPNVTKNWLPWKILDSRTAIPRKLHWVESSKKVCVWVEVVRVTALMPLLLINDILNDL